MLDPKNRVIVRVWLGSLWKKSVGHVSLQTPHDYFSFWPEPADDGSTPFPLAKQKACLIPTFFEDFKLENYRLPDVVICLYSLNVEKIEEEIAKVRAHLTEASMNSNSISSQNFNKNEVVPEAEISRQISEKEQPAYTLRGQKTPGTVFFTSPPKNNTHNCASYVDKILRSGGFGERIGSSTCSTPVVTPKSVADDAKKAKSIEKKIDPDISKIRYQEPIQYYLADLSEKTVIEMETDTPQSRGKAIKGQASIFGHDIDEEHWTITLLHNGPLTAGHSSIMIEGVKKGVYYCRQCDINAEFFPGSQSQGLIKEIRIFDTPRHVDCNLIRLIQLPKNLKERVAKKAAYIRTPNALYYFNQGVTKPVFIENNQERLKKFDQEIMKDLEMGEEKELSSSKLAKIGKIIKLTHHQLDFRFHRSWLKTLEQAERMLAAVERDKAITDTYIMANEYFFLRQDDIFKTLMNALANNEKEKIPEGTQYFLYQLVGEFNLNPGNTEAAHNCATWCYQKLTEANIHFPRTFLEHFVNPPSKHVKPGHGVAEFFSKNSNNQNNFSSNNNNNNNINRNEANEGPCCIM
ncbi:MAG: hypothetical protein K2Q14_03365 [Gammaproteobacteria bacterium]|nr:hypothetical protein [Gammaproteobacteria bacterium]